MQLDLFLNENKISHFQFENKLYLVKMTDIYQLDIQTGQWDILDKISARDLEKKVLVSTQTMKKTIGPAWTRGEIEKPMGERNMGSWISYVYTEEQQKRLGINELGEKI